MCMIIREQPDFAELRKSGYQIVDMHAHSFYSDASCSIKEMKRKAKRLGFGFCVCDHNQIRGSLEVCSDDDIFSVPSIEVTSCDAKDIILYFYSCSELIEFYESHIKTNRWSNIGFNLNRTLLTVPEIIRLSRKYNCLRVVPHPAIRFPKSSRKYFLGNPQLLDDISNIEVLNATMEKWRNLLSEDFAKKVSKPCIGGSDSHTIDDLGRVITVVQANDVRTFLDNIKAGRLTIIGREDNLIQGMFHRLALLKNNFYLSRQNMIRTIGKYDDFQYE